MKSAIVRCVVASVLIGNLSGCGTVLSMTGPGRDTPLVYGGTRMDIAEINGDQETLKKFDMEAPAHPRVDLPFSMVVDTLCLPVTLIAAGYRKLAW